jgi:hypothetical protein
MISPTIIYPCNYDMNRIYFTLKNTLNFFRLVTFALNWDHVWLFGEYIVWLIWSHVPHERKEAQLEKHNFPIAYAINWLFQKGIRFLRARGMVAWKDFWSSQKATYQCSSKQRKTIYTNIKQCNIFNPFIYSIRNTLLNFQSNSDLSKK